MTSQEINNHRQLAIVGYAHRLPGGLKMDDDLWNLLSEREFIRHSVVERYGKGVEPFANYSGPSRMASAWESLFRDGEEWNFDSAMFRISRNEVLQLDPQTRLLLGCTQNALEHAGWDLHTLHNSRTGVFIGGETPSIANWRPVHGLNEYIGINCSMTMLANRISYHFNLAGPSMTIGTACSSGISAMHLARNAILCGDCDRALVGGVNFLGSFRLSTAFSLLGIISKQGRCRPFDAVADGYVRAEGAIVIAMRPLEAAKRDGDRILAVVESTTVNSAGAADDTIDLSPGRMITTPTRHAQVAMMRDAYSQSGIGPEEFDYIEAHATGTKVGDRIEGNAIAEAYRENRQNTLRVSSIKSNLGHMEPAAFLCSLLKVILMMQKRTFAPTSRNYQVPNQEIDFASCPMAVQTECEPFPDHPVLIGINSFGFGGANGHCIIREYRPARKQLWSRPLAPDSGYMIPISARTPELVERSAIELRASLCEHNFDLYTLAGNLGCRRTKYTSRKAFVAKTQEDLLNEIDAFLENSDDLAVSNRDEPKLAFVFSGQGTQWVGCVRELFDSEPVFRKAAEAIEEHWQQCTATSLLDAALHATETQINQVQFAQPIIFLVQCALVELLKTWGVYADCVVGHSSGEVAAAYASGALTLEEATKLAYHRSIAQQSTAGSGRMLALGLHRSGVEALLDELGLAYESGSIARGGVEIACENSPISSVVCGRESVIQPLADMLKTRNIQNALLPGNIAFHSSAMEPIEHALRTGLQFLDAGDSTLEVPLISTVTGEECTRLDSRYWWSNVRQPVRFAAAMEHVIHEHNPSIVLEIAPHCALQPIIRQCLEEALAKSSCIPTLTRNSDTGIGFNRALGRLFEEGVALDFRSQYPRPRPIAHLLPEHPRNDLKEMDRYGDNDFHFKRTEFSDGPLLGHRLASYHLEFESRISEMEQPWLADHNVHHAAIMPAAGFIELILEAMQGTPCRIAEIEFLKPCPVGKVPIRLQTQLVPASTDEQEYNFTISSGPFVVGSQKELHCRGRVAKLKPDDQFAMPPSLEDIDTATSAWGQEMLGQDFYSRVESVLGDTFQYGPEFQTVKKIDLSRAPRAFRFSVEIDRDVWMSVKDSGLVLHPALLDGALQVFLLYQVHASDFFSLPRSARNVVFLRPPTSNQLVCHLFSSGEFGLNTDAYGQPTLRELCGSVALYDAATEELIAYVGEYRSFITNSRWQDLSQCKHHISWQPKFIRSDHELEQRLSDVETPPPLALIAALEGYQSGAGRNCHVIELAGARPPEETMIAQCRASLKANTTCSEWWVLGQSEELCGKYFEAFHHLPIPVRFGCLDIASPDSAVASAEMLRPQAAEIVLLHEEAVGFSQSQWNQINMLMVDGGVALIQHGGHALTPVKGWKLICTGQSASLLQAEKEGWEEHPSSSAEKRPRWVLGEAKSMATSWVDQLRQDNVYFVSPAQLENGDFSDLVSWPHAEDVRVIDFFCGDDPIDSVGEKLAARFVAFIQALVDHRLQRAEHPCLVRVVSLQAVYDVEFPRGQVLWGAVRCIALELPPEAKLDFRLVDIGTEEDLQYLKQLEHIDPNEREIIVRDKRPWVPRVQPVSEAFASVPEQEDPTYFLKVENPGQINGLMMKTANLPELKPHEVEIEVAASALNFRDIMITLGLLPPLAFERSASGRTVGMEGSGIIRRVGSAVETVQIGDEVMFNAANSIANRIHVHKLLACPKPDRLTFEEAAGFGTVYGTAYYALIHLARLQAGQRVLVHSAMGGVGQAAMALARWVGAEIYATAGNAAKREQLTALGARGVFDSRDFTWHDELMKATDGEGVDVVLNSLSGKHVRLCLDSVRPGGWHCEIGKIDIYENRELELRVFRKNLKYAAIDMDQPPLSDSMNMRKLLLDCIDLAKKGTIPPVPVTEYPYSKYTEAMRTMINGQHTGKLILKPPLATEERGFKIADIRPFLDPQATYLVTGGFGGFGLRVIPYLAAAGARHLTLIDRNPALKRNADWVRRSSILEAVAADIEIDILRGDVAVERDVQQCIEQLKRPLKGVFHLAAVLDDRLLQDMTDESIASVFAAKARGAWNLHNATQHCPLDHFVMFSSLSSVIGNPGQSNYGAANAFLDGLASYRKKRNLPALSYNMSAISEVGMLSNNHHALRMVRASGLIPVSANFAIIGLDYALRNPSQYDHLLMALFKHVKFPADSSDYMRIGRLMQNEDAFSNEQAADLTVDGIAVQIADKVAELCGDDAIELDEPFSSFGLTSIAVAELTAFIASKFNYRSSAVELMTTASARSLAIDILHGKSEDEAAESDHSNPMSLVANRSQTPHRVPSPFANDISEHFPSSPELHESEPANSSAVNL